jgi:hypothetical protein
MRSREVSVTDVSRHFSEFLNRVAFKGEHFLLRRGRDVVAELKPAVKGGRLGDLARLLKDLPRLSDAERRAFSDDVAKARNTLSWKKVRDAWGF